MTRVHLPEDLSRQFGTGPVVEVRARRLDEAVGEIDRAYPGLAHYLRADNGDFRPHLAVFVNGRRLGGAEAPATPLEDGADVWVLRSVSGG
jgi:molybdopterin synthase sulfur carrier subunit